MLFFKKEEIMDENEFWKIISILNWKYEGDDEKEILSELLYNLDGIEYAKNIGEDSYIDDNSFFSADSFLYSRCCVVANAKNYYYNVFNNPNLMPKDLEFESLLYLADFAYYKKNNEQLDIITKYSYETFSNKEKWK